MLAVVRKELEALSFSERLFILFALLCSFLIQAEYAAIRPASNALFLAQYGADYLPYAWFAAIPLNIFLVSWYNKYLPRLGCWKTFVCLISMVVGVNLFCALFIKKIGCDDLA